MRLYHVTDEASARAIARDGFQRSHHVNESGLAYLTSEPKNTEIGHGAGWVVIVAVPDAVAKAHQYVHPDGTDSDGIYRFPHEILNALMPFEYRQV